jgi:chemotaxis protein CheX
MTTTYDVEVEQIVQTVFSTMLKIDVARVPEGIPPNQDTLVASIQITGDWNGCVVLGLCPAASRAAAAEMFQIPIDDVTVADQQDVAGELANMIGGNFKSLLPGSSKLSLPTVVCGQEFGLRIHDAELLDDIWFGSDVGFMRTRVYTRIEK